jgi:hypothetical protein
MKRTAIALSMLVLLLSMALVSCDAMFSTNIFAKMTHPTPSSADILSKTPDQLQAYTSSATNIAALSNDPELKASALTALGYGASRTAPASALSATEQTAAIVAAIVSIKTVPAAAGFSASVLGTLAGGSSIPKDTAGITSLVKSVLPKDAADSLKAGDASPPASFVAMITAFSEANAAYTALGNGVVANSGSYASGLPVSSSEKSEIAVNAVLSGLIDAIVPASGADTPANVADSIWGGLMGQSSTFSISPTAVTDLTSATSSPIAGLVKASSLGALLEVK